MASSFSIQEIAPTHENAQQVLDVMQDHLGQMGVEREVALRTKDPENSEQVAEQQTRLEQSANSSRRYFGLYAAQDLVGISK